MRRLNLLPIERRERQLEQKRDAARRYRAKPEAKVKGAAYMRLWVENNRARWMFLDARRRAKKMGREFSITFEDLPPLGDRCPIFGTPFSREGVSRDTSPSLDRIDSSLGYVKGNVWFISWRANRIKSDGTAAEHEAIASAMRGAMASRPKG